MNKIDYVSLDTHGPHRDGVPRFVSVSIQRVDDNMKRRGKIYYDPTPSSLKRIIKHQARRILETLNMSEAA